MKNFFNYTSNGKMVYETQEDCVQDNGAPYVQTRRAVQQQDGSFWLYTFTSNSKSVGSPLRGKSRTAQINAFIEIVKAALAN